MTFFVIVMLFYVIIVTIYETPLRPIAISVTEPIPLSFIVGKEGQGHFCVLSFPSGLVEERKEGSDSGIFVSALQFPVFY